MSLVISKLEKVRELPGGIVQARCPACAEGGHDRTGEHLRIYPGGKFGCCVHPKDGAHRKRIFALAGERKPGTFSVRLRHSAGKVAGQSVKAALGGFHTPTSEGHAPPKTELENGVRGVRDLSAGLDLVDSRTPRTGSSELRTRAREDCLRIDSEAVDSHGELKDWESGVRGVRQTLPHLTPGGTLVIPFDSPERYHWWKPDGERLSVAETLREVKERMNHAVTV